MTSPVLSSSDVNGIVARSQTQVDKTRARASEHQRRSTDSLASVPSSSSSSSSSTILSSTGDEAREEVAERVARVTQRAGDYVQALANEPSVGLYHVQAHVLRTLPKWSELERELTDQVSVLERHRLDVDYSIGVVQQIVDLNSFASLLALSRRSVELVDQLRSMPPSRRRAAPATQ
jgi:uncharacterized protein YejL (UPF0352 family)